MISFLSLGKLESTLWLMTTYELFITYLARTGNTYELIIYKVNNIAFAHLTLALIWIVFGERTTASFISYFAVFIVGWASNLLT
jgi:hypothetical protein